MDAVLTGFCISIVAIVFVIWLNGKHNRSITQLTAEKARFEAEAREKAERINALETKEKDLQQQLTTVQAEASKARDAQIAEFTKVKDSLQKQLLDLAEEKSGVESELKTLKDAHKQWVDNVQEQWKQQFEAFMLSNLDQVKTNFEKKATEEYQEKQTALENKMKELLKPLNETIANYKKDVEQVGKDHNDQTVKIKEEMRRLAEINQRLSTALSHNKGRGDWGELELIRLLEDSGLQEGIGYVKQTSVGNERKRPDIRVNLCDGRCIFIDAKALQVDLNDLAEEDTPETAKARQKRYAKSLEDAISLLSGKEYQAELEAAANFVILYVPRESMLAHALCEDPALFEKAYRKNVILAGPFNMMGMLKLVHHSWVMSRLSDQAHDILELGKELQKQAVVFAEKFDKVGKSLDSLNKHYASAWTSFDGQTGFTRKIRKLEDYGCKHGNKLMPESAYLPEGVHPPVVEVHALTDGLASVTMANDPEDANEPTFELN